MNNLDILNKELGTSFKSLDDVNWYKVSERQKLSENFIREFQDDVYWDKISICQNLSEDFIREFQYYVDWYYISKYQKLSEKFMRVFQDKVNWSNVSIYQKLSEDFIKEFKEKVDWHYISSFQKLSENFIREFQCYVVWYYIVKYQKLSESFIREFKNKMDWDRISKYQKLSKKFRNEFKLVNDKDNWIYKTTKFKKRQIVKCGLYECHEDYFIAYKAIRSDRYSHYNFQYQYLPNEVYECHCDYTNDENSFGLSAWTNEGAKNYDSTGLIVKVKVRYEDVGRLVHNSNKIRCFKIEVLE